MSGIGTRMRSRREALRMTQEQLAEALGPERKQSEVSRWERGQEPGPKRTVEIADALGVDVRWLITGEGEPELSRDDAEGADEPADAA